MFRRLINISKSRSFFLFGARATGKTSLMQKLYSADEALFIDLLSPQLLSKLQAYPQEIEPLIRPAINAGKTVIIDEVQRVPALLDIAHQLIQREGVRFALTGSSARKLRRGSGNMLAGRASVYKLFPLLFNEIGQIFSLNKALEWGTLPEIVSLDNPDERLRALIAYTDTYVQEEIIAEQIVRKLPPFRRFLHAAAQMNGKIINYSEISADIHTDPTNVRNYFEILEDTLLGFRLESFHQSIRKRQRVNPKFYWFDTGVVRSLTNMLGVELRSGTSYYGELFEAFLITQIRAGLAYQTGQHRLSYLQTKDGAEIDLIVERPGLTTLCLEIKSGTQVKEKKLKALSDLTADISNAKAICLYTGNEKLCYGTVEVLPWRVGLEELGLVP